MHLIHSDSEFKHADVATIHPRKQKISHKDTAGIHRHHQHPELMAEYRATTGGEHNLASVSCVV